MNPGSDIGLLLSTKLVSWWEGLQALIPLILAGLLIIVVFYGLARLAKMIVRKSVSRTELPVPIQQIIAGTTSVAITAFGLIVALSVLGLQKAITTALAGAGVIGLALGFAFQDVAANFISGLFLIMRKPFATGDIITVNDQLGSVVAINLRVTKIKTPDGQMVYIPNKDVFQNNVINYSELGIRRVDIGCGVAYDTDLEQAQTVARKTIKDLSFVVEDRPVQIFFAEFGGSSIDFSIRFWIDFATPGDYPKAQDKAIRAIKNAFSNADIDIPFPIRTLEFAENPKWPDQS
ncbi:MAG: mechanosensitive ion channel protein MscS [Parcubacteria group bacterium SW_6_46_9]|nr:MAG: mechanosensitive ion channel protein MscS [Parcubacteria group bacterium SW_6_46_9]